MDGHAEMPGGCEGVCANSQFGRVVELHGLEMVEGARKQAAEEEREASGGQPSAWQQTSEGRTDGNAGGYLTTSEGKDPGER